MSLMEAEKSEKKKEKENESKMVSNSLEIMTQNNVEKKYYFRYNKNDIL